MFRKYKYVLAVYEAKNFTNAADKLLISQPSLSVAIRNIEEEIGCPLFERCGSKVRPTQIGDAYIVAAKKMKLAELEFERTVDDMNGLQIGHLSVGGSNLMSTDVLLKIIPRFQAMFPKINLNLVEANSMRLSEMLVKEEVDVVIDNFDEKDKTYELTPLISEHILLCVPESSNVNDRLKEFQISPDSIYNKTFNLDTVPAVSISHFANEDFILLKQGNDMHRRSSAIFQNNGVVPRVIMTVDQLNISYSLAESGLGTCFITDTLFKFRRHIGNVVLYKLPDTEAKRELYVGYKKSRYRTKAISEFINIARDMLKE